MMTFKMFTAITNSEMERKYFSAPRLNDLTPAKLNYYELKPLAVQTTYPGLAFDFNFGLRLKIPAGNWHVKILDHDSEIVCFDEKISDTLLVSKEKFFVRREFFLRLDGQEVFRHLCDPANRHVHFYLENSGMIKFLSSRTLKSFARSGTAACPARLNLTCRSS